MRTDTKTASREEHAILGALLKSYRLKLGLTQEVVAARIDRKHSYISRVESAHQHIDMATLFDFINAMGVEPKEFMAELCDEVAAMNKPKSSPD